MNAIEKKYQEHLAKIREIGSRIRVLGLDQDDTSPEHEERAAQLLTLHSEADVKEGLGFAAYLAEMASADCVACKGLGAVLTSRCDCSAIAKLYGGGGHRGAASFTCGELPWKVNEKHAPCEQCGAVVVEVPRSLDDK